jgi:hypothetical protein
MYESSLASYISGTPSKEVSKFFMILAADFPSAKQFLNLPTILFIFSIDSITKFYYSRGSRYLGNCKENRS